MQLYAHEGITPAIRRAFVIYLASHNRPVHEVLFPALRDISQDYERSFRGMTTDPVDLSALIAVRERLVADLQRMLETNERQFLLSLVKATPEWKLLDIAHLKQLPALRRKLTNLKFAPGTLTARQASGGDECQRAERLGNIAAAPLQAEAPSAPCLPAYPGRRAARHSGTYGSKNCNGSRPVDHWFWSIGGRSK